MTYPTIAAARVTLTVVSGKLDERRYVFSERTTCILGRSRDCDPRLPDDSHDTTVSRHHCLIDINPPHARIRDFGSRNGTFVNGEKIGQRKPGQTPEEAAPIGHPERDLSDGDEIRIGKTVLRVSITGTPMPTLTPPPDEDPRQTADKVAGYEVIRELGRGGTGAVYLARRTDSRELVALKVMLPKVAASEAVHERFLREIRITERLRHPNILSLFEASRTQASGAQVAFYFTSEYCNGGSLENLIRSNQLPRREAVRFIAEALDGLAHAHRQSVVHRDLSPDNILLTTGDREITGNVGDLSAKVSDFGLAKAFDEIGLSGLTRTGSTAGKPRYMARQQAVDFKDMTPAADVWSVAACLYAALTGTTPRTFPLGQDPWRVVMEEEAVPIREREPSIPPQLANVIDTALRERPMIGFQSAQDFRGALLESGILDS
jgi:pSer/pThr/pTyr-binding forkhead associated (FHA) protein